MLHRPVPSLEGAPGVVQAGQLDGAPVPGLLSLILDQVADLSYFNPDAFRINPAALPGRPRRSNAAAAGGLGLFLAAALAGHVRSQVLDNQEALGRIRIILIASPSASDQELPPVPPADQPRYLAQHGVWG
ncbi:MAG: hypothetical protein ACRDOK_08045 [Streptosporangiaceae bacterium]